MTVCNNHIYALCERERARLDKHDIFCILLSQFCDGTRCWFSKWNRILTFFCVCIFEKIVSQKMVSHHLLLSLEANKNIQLARFKVLKYVRSYGGLCARVFYFHYTGHSLSRIIVDQNQPRAFLRTKSYLSCDTGVQ